MPSRASQVSEPSSSEVLSEGDAELAVPPPEVPELLRNIPDFEDTVAAIEEEVGGVSDVVRCMLDALLAASDLILLSANPLHAASEEQPVALAPDFNAKVSVFGRLIFEVDALLEANKSGYAVQTVLNACEAVLEGSQDFILACGNLASGSGTLADWEQQRWALRQLLHAFTLCSKREERAEEVRELAETLVRMSGSLARKFKKREAKACALVRRRLAEAREAKERARRAEEAQWATMQIPPEEERFFGGSAESDGSASSASAAAAVSGEVREASALPEQQHLASLWREQEEVRRRAQQRAREEDAARASEARARTLQQRRVLARESMSPETRLHERMYR